VGGAAYRAHFSEGYRQMDALPRRFPIEELHEALRGATTPGLPLNRADRRACLGCVGGYLPPVTGRMRLPNPLNIAGKALQLRGRCFIPGNLRVHHSRAASPGGGARHAGAETGLPMPYHPVLQRAAFPPGEPQPVFFLCIEAHDPKFRHRAYRDSFLEALGDRGRVYGPLTN